MSIVFTTYIHVHCTLQVVGLREERVNNVSDVLRLIQSGNACRYVSTHYMYSTHTTNAGTCN